MIDKSLELEVLRLATVENWRPNTIATQLGVHHSVVTRVLAQAKVSDSESRTPKVRLRMVDDYLPFIEETLEKYPSLSSSRLFQMVQERGYRGKISQFRNVLMKIRPKRKEAFLRLSSLPGEEAQVDWAHFGKIGFGNHSRQLMAFVMVLSHSRAVYLQFFPCAQLHCFLEGHINAFEWFGGIPRRCLYDNLKSVVIERTGSIIRFNEDFLEFSRSFLFEPRPVGVARGNEKGRVERAIRFIRSSFFAGRMFSSIEDLNVQATIWCNTISLDRLWEQDKTKSVREVLTEERARLMHLPQVTPSFEDSICASVGKTPYIRVDTNNYSVPPECVGSSVVVKVSSTKIRVISGSSQLAEHDRCWEKHKTIENQSHIKAIRAMKSRGVEKSKLHSVTSCCPSASEVLSLLAERKLSTNTAVRRLYEFITLYGAQEVEIALQQAIKLNNVHPNSILRNLENERKLHDKPRPVPLLAITDPRVRDSQVQPHNLQTYHVLNSKKGEDHEE